MLKFILQTSVLKKPSASVLGHVQLKNADNYEFSLYWLYMTSYMT